MKKLFKWLVRLMLVFVLLIALLIFFLDPIAKSLMERQIRRQTGLDVTIGKLSIGLRNPMLTVENFKLINSPEFGDSLFIAIPQLLIQYDLQALRSRKIHLNLVALNLGELHVVQGKDGKTNLQALQEREKQKDSGSGTGASAVEFECIDMLKLSIGKLKFTSDKNPARNEEAYVGMKNETVKNIRSMKDLQPLIARIALEKGLNFLSENLGGQGTNHLQNAAQSAAKHAQKTLGGATDQLKKP